MLCPLRRGYDGTSRAVSNPGDNPKFPDNFWGELVTALLPVQVLERALTTTGCYSDDRARRDLIKESFSESLFRYADRDNKSELVVHKLRVLFEVSHTPSELSGDE